MQRTGSRSMRRIIVWAAALLIAALAIGVPRAPAREEGETTVEVRGLRLVGKAHGDEWRGLRAFNWTPGTSMALLVIRPDGGIIDMDEEKSTIETLKDDRGTNLLEGGKFGNMGYGFSSVAEDASALMTEVKGPNLPAEGATTITAKGTLVLKTASEQKTAETPAEPLEKGRKLRAPGGPFEWEVTKAEPGQGSFLFTLTARQDLSAIKEIKFLDGEGEELEVRARGTWTMHGENVRVDSNYEIDELPGRLRLKVTWWTDMAEQEVPFELTTGLGLGE